jgi:UDP-N-acetylmuramate dehydrogenase
MFSSSSAPTDLSPRLETHVDLHTRNTLGLPGRAQYAVTVHQVSEVQALIQRGDCARQPIHIWGGGSNTVLAGDLSGIVIQVAILGRARINDLSTATHHVIEVGAGENWYDLVTWTLKEGYPGLENLALIPGTAGAAPIQNIGAYGLELKDRLHSVTGVDLRDGTCFDWPASICQLGYRDSFFKHPEGRHYLITHIRLALPISWTPVLNYGPLQALASELSCHPTPVAQAWAIYERVCTLRRQKLPDPAIQGNVGSFFKNPVVNASQLAHLLQNWPDLVHYSLSQPYGHAKLAAAWLIEQCGWKAYEAGSVGVHPHQALVLVNKGGATGADILCLAKAIQSHVLARFGIELDIEPLIRSR